MKPPRITPIRVILGDCFLGGLYFIGGLPWLPREMFIRIHRSYIVNLYHVKGFVGKALRVDNKILPVSSLYQEEVFACFDFWDSAKRDSEKMKGEK